MKSERIARVYSYKTAMKIEYNMYACMYVCRKEAQSNL